VLEPLLVKPSPNSGRWLIIAGEGAGGRRDAGLHEVPCVEMNVDDQSVAEIALIENMQRKDLTPWEEADGLRAFANASATRTRTCKKSLVRAEAR